ncbi:MAG: asparagine synthase (glutamine-hydrolyzing) [Victivallales bacterium]|nr:asparagine synthase (glutamine-hydrolyzing) [Victivallales bacterium]
MCGICGILAPDGVDNGKGRIGDMLTAMSHRGPDGRDIDNPSIVPEVLLGHVRLSIIAPGAAASQPMTDEGSGNVITFNGEIYNYRELREELKGHGCQFRTQSDTEVLLKAYEHWGRGCLVHLNGIYAFAIWDSRNDELFAARDPLGVKPFYYAWGKKCFVFASEVRALLASGLVERRVSHDGLDSLLAYGSVQEPFTLVEGVRSLPAGAMICLSRDFHLEVKESSLVSPEHGALPEGEIQERVSTALSEAVRRQLLSDVPLGVFLSGGIDSAAIATLAARQKSNLSAFTVVFDEPDLDERERARSMANRLGLEHHELELTSAEIRENAMRALDAQDQPSIDGLNTWFVSKLVRDAGIKVALSGLGGDELFAGYGGFYRPRRLMRLAFFMRFMPAFMRRLLQDNAKSEAVQKLAWAVDFPISPYFLTRQIMGARMRTWLEEGVRYQKFVSPFPPRNPFNGFPSWMQESFQPLCHPIETGQGGENDLINSISYWELSTYMRSTLLRDADCMGMAHGLEIRVPLIDRELVELLFRVPGILKLSPKLHKPLLVNGAGLDVKEAMAPKRGFNMPIQRIMQEVCAAEAKELFLASSSDCFSSRALQEIWTLYANGRIAWQRIWCIYVALRWLGKILELS